MEIFVRFVVLGVLKIVFFDIFVNNFFFLLGKIVVSK